MFITKTLKISVFIFVLLLTMQCATQSAPVIKLPDNISGIKLGMNKDEAEDHLKEIGKFSRDENKNQQIWSLNENPNFGYIALGYDAENRVRYVAAFAKPKGGKLVRYDEIGDLKTAKEESVGQFHRYTWQVAEQNGNPAYSVVAQGNTQDYLSTLTLAKPPNKADEEEEEREQKERRN